VILGGTLVFAAAAVACALAQTIDQLIVCVSSTAWRRRRQAWYQRPDA
jgi:NaMN:DMB phosphoribosyltransferase